MDLLPITKHDLSNNCGDCNNCVTGEIIYRHVCPKTGRKWAFFTEPKDSPSCEHFEEKK